MNDFDEYIRQGEPSRVEKAQNWQTAIGLQQVDGLTPSAYLIEQAKQHIEGDITIDEVKNRYLHIKYVVPERTENVTDDVTDRSLKIMALIKADNRILTTIIAAILSVSKRTVLRDLEKLKLSGKIIREGNEKTGSWEIIDKEAAK